MLKGHLSAEAQRFLCNEQYAPSGRSESKLADLRSATKVYITPAVKQVLASTKVTTRHIVINDVACLEVAHHGILADSLWVRRRVHPGQCI